MLKTIRRLFGRLKRWWSAPPRPRDDSLDPRVWQGPGAAPAIGGDMEDVLLRHLQRGGDSEPPARDPVFPGPAYFNLKGSEHGRP